MGHISVCMATYNGGHFIEKQIKSILNQLSMNDELIISDDSSTDDTVSIITTVADRRIKLFTNPNSRSITRNFENALSKATGDYIFLADQDDIWYPDKVEVMKAHLEYNDLVVSDCNFIDESDRIIGNSFFETYKSGEGVLKNFIKNSYLGNCMAFTRRVLDECLPFPDEIHRATRFMVFQDVWIGILADSMFQVKFVPQVLSGFRRHQYNASPTESMTPSPQSMLKKANGRLLLALGLLKRLIHLS